MIQTIIFDIGNVLVHFRWKAYFESLGYDSHTVSRMANASVLSDHWKELDLGNLCYDDILRLFIKNDPDIEMELRASLSDLSQILGKTDYAVLWLKELKQQGYQLLFLSNFSEKVFHECAHAMDFLPLMDGGIFSYKVNLIKPNPAIYEMLLKNYHLKPSECVFIDDTQENIDAAKKLGIHGITFVSLQQAKKELESLGIT